jgi:hypothetical protein
VWCCCALSHDFARLCVACVLVQYESRNSKDNLIIRMKELLQVLQKGTKSSEFIDYLGDGLEDDKGVFYYFLILYLLFLSYFILVLYFFIYFFVFFLFCIFCIFVFSYF